MTEAKDFQNPLLINVIAERILQFVPVAHLKACRLVSRLWWKESLPRWRRTHWLQVSGYDLNTGKQESNVEKRNEESTHDEIQMRRCLHIDSYISFWEDPLDPYELRSQPFQKLKLFKSQFTFESGKNDELEGFLTQTGSAVKFLTLEKCTFESLEDFRKMVFRFSPNLEYLCLADNLYKGKRPRKNQLTNLNLNTLVENESDVQSQLKYLKVTSPDAFECPNEASPLTWTQFLAHLPNIQNLELENFFMRLVPLVGHEDHDFIPVNDIFGSIHALRRDCGILQRLTGLDVLNKTKFFLYQFDGSMVDVLRRISLPLTFLAIDIGYKQASGHKREITCFVCIAWVNCERHLHGFPKLFRNDKYFVVPTNLGKGQEGTICLPKAIERIQKIHKVDDNDWRSQCLKKREKDVVRDTDFSKMSHLSFPNIEECLLGEQLCYSYHVKKLARLMPNLKRLRIGVDQEGFRAICKYWKGLEALDLFSAYRVTEEGITGIVPGEEARLPNITDLKYLRSFGMCCIKRGRSKNVARVSELTDLSLEQGLLQLKYLERVAVSCSADKMSDENYERFKSMFPPYPYSAIHRGKTCDDSDD